MALNSCGRRAGAISVLEARHRDLPTRLAAWLRTQHPAAVFAAVAGVGYFLVAGLALLTSIFRRRWVSAVCWSLAFALPAIVAWSRMYRGMHHLSDVCAGALVGGGALVVALMATRACGQAVRERRRAPAPPPRVGART